MSFEQWGALLGVAATLIVAITGLLKVVLDAVALRRKGEPEPAPEVGIPAVAEDDIDYRAYQDMKEDRDRWRSIALGEDEGAS